MNTFWQEILGKNDPGVLAAAFVFALIGHAIVLLGGAAILRDPASQNSPRKFSLSYLLCDNAKRILYVLLLIVVGLRFLPDLIGMQVSGWGGFLVGSGLDLVALLIKQKTKLLDPKS